MTSIDFGNTFQVKGVGRLTTLIYSLGSSSFGGCGLASLDPVSPRVLKLRTAGRAALALPGPSSAATTELTVAADPTLGTR